MYHSVVNLDAEKIKTHKNDSSSLMSLDNGFGNT